METVEKPDPQGFRGKVHGVSLLDLLQMFHLSRRTITLRLDQGAIHLREGELVHAEANDLQGEAALQHLLTLKGGDLDVGEDESPSTVVSVERPFETVLIEALVRMDELQGGLNHAEIQERAASLVPPPRSACRSVDFDQVCETIVSHVQDALCAAVVLLDNGIRLAGMAASSDLGDVDTYLERAASVLFQSDAVGEVEGALNAMIAEPPSEERESTEVDDKTTYCDEIHLLRGPYLYLGRTLGAHGIGVLVITHRSCPIGLGIAQLNSSLTRSGWQKFPGLREVKRTAEG